MDDNVKPFECLNKSSRSRLLDQFYTKTEIAKQCYEKLSLYLTEKGVEFDLFLEPSAGSGAFFNILPNDRRMGFDLEPKCDGVVIGDFFEQDFPNKKLISIGNPPFGKNSSLAVRFFNRCAELGPIIAMIFPLTFRKHSVQKRLNENFHLVYDWQLPKNSFVFNGDAYDVPCSFQIWKKEDRVREKVSASMTHPDFEFVLKNEADFAVQRVGVNAGAVKNDFSKCAVASHYFIRAKDKVRFLEVASKIDWNSVKHHTAGNPSVSKTELISLYSKIALIYE